MLNKLALTFQVIYDVTMTSQRYCEKCTSLNRFGRRLGIVGQQVMLNKLALTFQVIYDVTMTSQRYCEKCTSLNRFRRRLGIAGQQVMLNKLALTFQVICDVLMTSQRHCDIATLRKIMNRLYQQYSNLKLGNYSTLYKHVLCAFRLAQFLMSILFKVHYSKMFPVQILRFSHGKFLMMALVKDVIRKDLKGKKMLH